MHTMTTPAHEMVEIEQNQETGEVLTANGVPLTPAKEWREEEVKRKMAINEYLHNYGLEDGSSLDAGEIEELCESIVEHFLTTHSAHLVERIEALKKKTGLDRSSLAIGMHEHWHNQALDQAIDIVKDNK